MSVSLGIITAEKSMEKIKAIEPAIQTVCSVSYFPYTSLQHLTKLYLENAYKFDGLVFSGCFPYDYIVNNVGIIQKPHVYFDVTDRDYYKLIAKILVQHPGIKFPRVLIEKPGVEVDFAGIFGSADMPMLQSAVANEAYMMHIGTVYELSLEFYRRLWRENKVDLIVTRLSNLAGPLAASGVPFELLFPSPSSMIETVHKLVGHIQSIRLNNAMTAVGMVLALYPTTEEQTRLLEKTLSVFNERNNMSLVVRRHQGRYELTTSNEIMQDITQNATACLLTEFLKERLDFEVCIGWGAGGDVVQAQKNADKALRESQRNREHLAYLVTAQNEVIGPLSGSHSMVYTDMVDEQSERISRALGISTLNYQKLSALQSRKGLKRFTSQDLAGYLNITQRSATRILGKLAAHSGAAVVRNQYLHARGRPVKVYELDLENLYLK